MILTARQAQNLHLELIARLDAIEVTNITRTVELADMDPRTYEGEGEGVLEVYGPHPPHTVRLAGWIQITKRSPNDKLATREAALAALQEAGRLAPEPYCC